MNERNAIVRIGGRRVGTLKESRRTVTFQYDSDWLRETGAVLVSLTLPLRSLFGKGKVPGLDIEVSKLHTAALAMVGHTAPRASRKRSQ